MVGITPLHWLCVMDAGFCCFVMVLSVLSTGCNRRCTGRQRRVCAGCTNVNGAWLHLYAMHSRRLCQLAACSSVLPAASKFSLCKSCHRGQRHPRGARQCRVLLQPALNCWLISPSWLGKSTRRGANPSRRRGRGVVFAEICSLLQHSDHCLPRRSLEKQTSQGEQNQ